MIVRALPTMGAELTGLSLAQLDERAFQGLLEAFWQYAVLVFPGQHLSEAEHGAFSKRIGRLERLVTRKATEAPRPEDEIGKLSNVLRGGELAAKGSSLWLFLEGNQYWHTDSSFKRVSAKASMLSAVVVPATGGETEWADMRKAHDALPEAQRQFWADKIAVHSYGYSQGRVGGTDVLSPDNWRELPPVRHPVIRQNEDSGRKSLFIGRHASHVEGMEEAEGRKLLQDLCDWATQPRWVYRHSWRPGDVVLWDNRSVLHRGLPWPASEPRIMHRTTIAGDGLNEWAIPS